MVQFGNQYCPVSIRSDRVRAFFQIDITMPSSNHQTRLTQLSLWVAKQLKLAEIHLVSLGGDAGFRQYFRFNSPSSYLAVDAPPATEDTAQFLRVADLLTQFRVRTPGIIAADEAQGFLLVEDLGDNLMYQNVQAQNADSQYQQAIDLIIRMQHIQPKPEWLPDYTADFLWREMQLFTEWFVEKLLAYSLADSETQLLNNSFANIINSATSQPQVFVHRDFHSRNLLTTENEMATIDFQGALWGPVTYDLVSLLRDCYLRWPQEKVQHWALDFYHKQKARSAITASSEEFIKWFDWMGLQRHIKVLGIFARLHLRDNKHHYLRDLPLVIRYLLEVSSSYPELTEFTNWFAHKLLPLAEQQDWYCDYQTAGECR